ncbi:MAG: hypothetical protein SFZ03_11400 [Candidatus Melainabacteria bacterium]|nr:hypothetical protein [Candidatus Melainabacteria bacterium]
MSNGYNFASLSSVVRTDRATSPLNRVVLVHAPNMQCAESVEVDGDYGKAHDEAFLVKAVDTRGQVWGLPLTNISERFQIGRESGQNFWYDQPARFEVIA